jgi:hypothetical protein
LRHGAGADEPSLESSEDPSLEPSEDSSGDTGSVTPTPEPSLLAGDA